MGLIEFCVLNILRSKIEYRCMHGGPKDAWSPFSLVLMLEWRLDICFDFDSMVLKLLVAGFGQTGTIGEI